MSVEIRGDRVIVVGQNGKDVEIRCKPRSVIERFLGAILLREWLSTLLVDMGEKPMGIFESVESLWNRYRDAIVQKAAAEARASCDVWQDEIQEGGKCAGCERDDIEHAYRCGVDGPDFPAFDDFLARTEGRDECDACGRTQAEHARGARPAGRKTVES